MPRRAVAVVTLLVTLLIPKTSSAEEAVQTGEYGEIEGLVIDAASAAALSDAKVKITQSSGAWSQAMVTDASGRFNVTRLPIGKYYISVTADHYLPGAFGQIWPLGPSRPFQASRKRSTVTVALWRFAAISGRVTDRFDRGIAGVTVSAWPALRVTLLGETSYETSQPLTTVTDNFGGFRFPNVKPAEYYLAVVATYRQDCAGTIGTPCGSESRRATLPTKLLSSAGSDTFESTFYPGVPTLNEAQTIAVHSGEDRTGITLTLEAQPGIRLTGRISGPEGPQGEAFVSLVRLGNVGAAITDELRYFTAISDREGRFSMHGVIPGSYDLIASYYPRTGTSKPAAVIKNAAGDTVVGGFVAGIAQPTALTPVLQARQRVTFDKGRDSSIDIFLQRASTVRGLIKIGSQGASEPEMAGLEGRTVMLRPLTSTALPLTLESRMTASGTFEFGSVAEGTYRLHMATPANLTVTSTQFDGTLSPDKLVKVACCGTIVVTIELGSPSGGARIKGLVRTPTGSTNGNGFVFVFPPLSAEQVGLMSGSRFQAIPYGDGGSFVSGALPDGSYQVVAVSGGLLPFDWREREVLSTLSLKGTLVKVTNGMVVPLTLTAVRIQ